MQLMSDKVYAEERKKGLSPLSVEEITEQLKPLYEDSDNESNTEELKPMDTF